MAAYIRYHNWFSDTLELDRAAVNLPLFLGELAERFEAAEEWRGDPLRIVPAPKSQSWWVRPDTKRWEPTGTRKTAAAIRPLAHVSLMDQVAATAVTLCLADRVETLQGDPRGSIADTATRRKVVSYGNRLFCDASAGELHHRWGSGKFYRAYYDDYRTFLARPKRVAAEITTGEWDRAVIVHSDLRQFYDRVRPELLASKLRAIARPDDDPRFYRLTDRLLNWEWDKRDAREIARRT